LNFTDNSMIVGTLHRTGKPVAEIENGKIEGPELSFSVKNTNGLTKWMANYGGKISGDAVAGTALVEANGQSWEFSWRPKRNTQE
jgi:hypothetical protein